MRPVGLPCAVSTSHLARVSGSRGCQLGLSLPGWQREQRSVCRGNGSTWTPQASPATQRSCRAHATFQNLRTAFGGLRRRGGRELGSNFSRLHVPRSTGPGLEACFVKSHGSSGSLTQSIRFSFFSATEPLSSSLLIPVPTFGEAAALEADFSSFAATGPTAGIRTTGLPPNSSSSAAKGPTFGTRRTGLPANFNSFAAIKPWSQFVAFSIQCRASSAGSILEAPAEVQAPRMPIIIILDIETTGRSTKARIVELAVRDMAGGEHSAFHTLVNPGEGTWMDPEAQNVHAISLWQVQKPSVPDTKTVGRALVEFTEFRRRIAPVKGTTELPEVLFVAHNGSSFDFRFLYREFSRVGLGPFPAHWRMLDSLQLLRTLFKDHHDHPGSFGLEVFFEYCQQRSPELMREMLGGLTIQSHRAMGDVDMLAMALHWTIKEFQLSVSDLMERSVTSAQWLQDYHENQKKQKKKT